MTQETSGATPTGHVPLPYTAHGISAQEQAEIKAEIENAFHGTNRLHGVDGQERLSTYQATRRGILLPTMLNVVAVIVTAAAILFLISYFDREERLLADTAASGVTAQARLLEQFRADSEERLSAHESEIARIRAELATLSRRAPGTQPDRSTARRIAELEADLERALNVEQELAIEADLAQAFLELEQRQQQGQLLAAQLTAAIARIAELESRPQPAAVERVAVEPVVIRELPDEQVEELHQLRDTAAQLSDEIQRLHNERENIVAERDRLAAERNTLSGRLAQVTGERNRLQAGLTRLQTEQKARTAGLGDRLSALSQTIASAQPAAQPNRDAVLNAVQSKVEVLQILTTEPIRSRHPGLDARLEHYLDTLAAESRREGRISGLREAVAVLERVKSADATTENMSGRFSRVEQSTVRELLSQLDSLLR